MNIEEIIPFLVFVVWIVRSVITQKRKAEEQRKLAEKARSEQPYASGYEESKPKRKTPVIVESAEPEFDILEELLGRKVESKPTIPKRQQQPIVNIGTSREKELKEKQMALQMKHAYEKEKLRFKKGLDETFGQKQVHKKIKRKLRSSKSTLSSFSLKKGVVFSEILNRPYR